MAITGTDFIRYQTGAAMRDAANNLAGFAAEGYTLNPETLWESARDSMKAEEWRACRRELGGDTYRNLRVHTQLKDPTWKHILFPHLRSELRLWGPTLSGPGQRADEGGQGIGTH